MFEKNKENMSKNRNAEKDKIDLILEEIKVLKKQIGQGSFTQINAPGSATEL